MTLHLTTEQALRIARRAIEDSIEVRDIGLLDADDQGGGAAAFARAQPPAGRRDKRSAWLATYVFCAKNGVELDPSDDEAYALVVSVAAGDVSDVPAIAAALTAWAR